MSLQKTGQELNRSLLIVGAGIEACEGIKLAQQMNLRLIIADGNPNAPGFAYADIKIVASTYEPDLILSKLNALGDKALPIHGVIAMCADVPVCIAKIASAFNLPGLSLTTAESVADKLLMKQELRRAGIAVPNFTEVNSEADIQRALSIIQLPIVIKPVDSRGARGVQLIHNESALIDAYREAKQESPTGRVMAEEYISGPQISTETLISNRECFTLGFADRNYEWLPETQPYFIENGGDTPSCLAESDQMAITDLVEHAALGLGISNGVAKGDMVLSERGPMVIEIAGRLSGGYFSTTQIPLATGINFIEQAIKIALGDPLIKAEVTPNNRQAVAIRYLALSSGTVANVTGIKEARELEGVEKLMLFVSPGDSIKAVKNHTQRYGFAICSGETKSIAIERANSALNKIHVTYR